MLLFSFKIFEIFPFEVLMKSTLQSSENEPLSLDTSSNSNNKSTQKKSKFPRKKIDKCLAKAFSPTKKSAEEYAAMRIINWVDNIMTRIDRKLAR